MNSKDKGNIGEAVVLAEAIKRGYVVLQPFGDNAKYDLVFDDSTSLLKVQIKAVTPKNGKLILPCYSNTYDAKTQKLGGKRHVYTANDADIIMCVDLNSLLIYKLAIDTAISIMTKNGEIALRIDQPKNNQVKGVRWAKDYLWR